MSVLFRVVDGPDWGQELSYYSRVVITMGRSLHCGDSRIAGDPEISRNHVLLVVDPPNCEIKDLGSRHGTFVNGVQVQRGRLRNGDVLELGQTKVLMSVPGSFEDELLEEPDQN